MEAMTTDVANMESVTKDKICEFRGCFASGAFSLDLGINVYNPRFSELPFHLCMLHTRYVQTEIDEYHHCSSVLWELLGRNGLRKWRADELIYFGDNMIGASEVILKAMRSKIRIIMESWKLSHLPKELYLEIEVLNMNIALCLNLVSERQVYALEKRGSM